MEYEQCSLRLGFPIHSTPALLFDSLILALFGQLRWLYIVRFDFVFVCLSISSLLAIEEGYDEGGEQKSLKKKMLLSEKNRRDHPNY